MPRKIARNKPPMPLEKQPANEATLQITVLDDSTRRTPKRSSNSRKELKERVRPIIGAGQVPNITAGNPEASCSASRDTERLRGRIVHQHAEAESRRCPSGGAGSSVLARLVDLCWRHLGCEQRSIHKMTSSASRRRRISNESVGSANKGHFKTRFSVTALRPRSSLLRKRQRADALAGQCEESVAHRRAHGRQAGSPSPVGDCPS